MSIDCYKNYPILEDPNETLRNYILNPQIPIHDPDLDFLPRKPNSECLYYIPHGTTGTNLIPERDPQSGEILDFIETIIKDAGCTSKNSMSLQRAPGPPNKATRGSAMHFPFWPGGFDDPAESINELKIDNYDFENDLLTMAPGFVSGLNFSENSSKKMESSEIVMVDLLSIVEQENQSLGLWNENKIESNKKEEIKPLSTIPGDFEDSILNIPDLLPDSVLEISKVDSNIPTVTQWAEMMDVSQPVKDFNERIPNPAHKYPFELDTFQKQAIIKLEEHNHVFVAAHTSAGKTVVAEYAIALSQKHMTRAIYTSPIKALSNQKYRDFKKTFGDVGLITGDLQIDPTASCLIMTTEILRSMLHCGSDVTRDLEYAIFDEIHYITDSERGYVWEEVLILLPDHVSIVMLSATVPNTLEFANWVGQTKKRKVYVSSTLYRPVPLQHYLYTGNGGKSRDENFLVVNQKGDFLLKGHSDAVAAKNSRKKDHQRNFLNAKQEQTLWVGMIDYLKRFDKLPVVAFTLSRNRCDQNAEALRSVDLCTAKEASKIKHFFDQCLQKLKPPDRIIPQVLRMKSNLERGIGVHHSGILPILKEIVEMLFADGLVKLLFATETFAMGVNMPARTVIFDSTQKFDGIERRILRPAEYTQMAGRAGRRGLDPTGTVILICKHDVPLADNLKQMMLGKPMRLTSQFRWTYATILNLLRLKNVSYEGMMSHSFREYSNQLKVPENKEKLKNAEKNMLQMQPLGDHLQPLCDFYDISMEFIEIRSKLMPLLFDQQKIVKDIKPGLILKISHGIHYNKLGVLLSIHASSNKEPFYKILVLDHQIINQSEIVSTIDRGDIWNKMISLTVKNKSFIPEGIGGHAVLTIKPCDVVEISKKKMKIDPDVIIKNWEQRQIPRFKDSPPGPTVIKTVNELNNFKNEPIDFINFSHGLDLAKSHVMEYINSYNQYKKKLEKIIDCTNISNFEQEYAVVYDRKQLEKRCEDLKFKISPQNCSTYPDYCNKLLVLQELNYIDEQQQVALKGRVACQMGSNELIITELILSNILTDLDPAEIAALLSSLVFQAKTDIEPELTDSLKKSIAEIENIDKLITDVERTHFVSNPDERLNFGLVKVVYEWARNKPFAEIMDLTDIQEGIIVRCILQLNETLHNVKDAARIIGNPGLHSKMEEASNAIKRDIVFAASLYTQKETVVGHD